MKTACPRLFEAEARRDGRLSGAEVARFEAHLGVCPICAQEVHALEALAAALRSPVAACDELHVRRERTRLLAAFDATLVPSRRHRPTRLLVAVAAAVAVLSLVALALVLRPSHPAANVAPPVAAIGIRADATTKWSRRAGTRREEVILESGTLSINVAPAASVERRLVVLLPDGELEDIGTTFSVSAHAGRTSGVSVQHGSVVLRLRGLSPVTLSAGESWQPSLASVPVPASSSQAPLAALDHPKPASRARQHSQGSAADAHARIPAAHPVDPAAHGADSASDFRKAVSALNAGDNALAVELLTAFMTEHPRDSRTEDAAYLLVLAWHRAGNVGRMKSAASEYLRLWPQGFRRAEVERLSR